MTYLIITDVDGTINKMGQKFNIAAVRTIAPMVNARKTLSLLKDAGNEIVYLTGREKQKFGLKTILWLYRHNFPDFNHVIFSDLQNWTHSAYIKFKISKIHDLIKNYPNLYPVLVENDNDVLGSLNFKDILKFKIEKEKDWEVLYQALARYSSKEIIQ